MDVDNGSIAVGSAELSTTETDRWEQPVDRPRQQSLLLHQSQVDYLAVGVFHCILRCLIEQTPTSTPVASVAIAAWTSFTSCTERLCRTRVNYNKNGRLERTDGPHLTTNSALSTAATKVEHKGDDQSCTNGLARILEQA